MPDSTRQTVAFPDLFGKPTHVRFDEPDLTTDGGALLLEAVDDHLGLTGVMTRSLRESRSTDKIVHSFHNLFRQRVYGLTCGYADVNDVARIGRDLLHKALLDRDPLSGLDLASQPTLSRFENSLSKTDLYRMSEALLNTVLDRHRKRLGEVRCITIDRDPTDDATHGQQEFAFYNGHYGNWCYLPMPCFVSFDKEFEQYLVALALRSGSAPAKQGATGILLRVVEQLRTRFPKARIRVRLDGGCAGPDILGFLEEQGVEYLVAMAQNKVLERISKRLMGTVRRLSRESGQSEALFGETRNAAQSWNNQKRRVIYKGEFVQLEGREPRDNFRFVVTNLSMTPQNIYKLYRQRGDVENRIKELEDGLHLDRTSCHRFLANQLRVLMTATAYALLQELRLKLKRTSMASAQVETLRLKLLKIAGRVQRSCRRICLHLSEHHAWAAEWMQAARAVGAMSP